MLIHLAYKILVIIYLQGIALRICLLFLDVALASVDPWKFFVSSTFQSLTSCLSISFLISHKYAVPCYFHALLFLHSS